MVYNGDRLGPPLAVSFVPKVPQGNPRVAGTAAGARLQPEGVRALLANQHAVQARAEELRHGKQTLGWRLPPRAWLVSAACKSPPAVARCVTNRRELCDCYAESARTRAIAGSNGAPSSFHVAKRPVRLCKGFTVTSIGACSFCIVLLTSFCIFLSLVGSASHENPDWLESAESKTSPARNSSSTENGGCVADKNRNEPVR